MSDYTEFSNDILKLHILYLEKFEKLSKGERGAYEKYFIHLANPKVNIKIPEDFYIRTLRNEKTRD